MIDNDNDFDMEPLTAKEQAAVWLLIAVLFAAAAGFLWLLTA
jgi:hypothetical protein